MLFSHFLVQMSRLVNSYTLEIEVNLYGLIVALRMSLQLSGNLGIEIN
jgi:hypothetical protein